MLLLLLAVRMIGSWLAEVKGWVALLVFFLLFGFKVGKRLLQVDYARHDPTESTKVYAFRHAATESDPGSLGADGLISTPPISRLLYARITQSRYEQHSPWEYTSERMS